MALRCNVFFNLFMTAPSKTPTFESIFAAVGDYFEPQNLWFRVGRPSQSRKTSRDSSGGTGRLWRSGSALGGSGGALGGPGGALGGSGGALEELWEALYIDKLPINRKAAVMLLVITTIRCSNSNLIIRLLKPSG